MGETSILEEEQVTSELGGRDAIEARTRVPAKRVRYSGPGDVDLLACDVDLHSREQEAPDRR